MATNAARVVEDADTQLFKVLAEYAGSIPIVLVGTQTDNFLDNQETKIRRELSEQSYTDPLLLEKATKEKVQEIFLQRQADIQNELGAISTSRASSWDDAVYVSRGLNPNFRCEI